MIASHVTEGRTKEDAQIIMKKAKGVNFRKKPRLIITDGLSSYRKAFFREFYEFGKKVDCGHWRLKGFEIKPNNNLIERYHSTFRARDKTMRGFKDNEQAVIDGFRNYYNFIRPHMGLNGLTPAQIAGIVLPIEQNRWLGLLKNAK